jgi:type IV fimbrial biogenesis protein FimT
MARVYAPKRGEQRETPQIQRFCELLRGARPQQNLPMRKRMNRGVTLMELCFGLALVAVVAGLAAPGFRSSLRAAAVRAGTYELLTGLHQTRATSIVESQPGTLCPSDADGNCLPSATPAGFWRASLDVHPLPAGIVVRASRSPLRFWPDALSASTGTLTICDVRGLAPPRAIVISQTGRARVASAVESACR